VLQRVGQLFSLIPYNKHDELENSQLFFPGGTEQPMSRSAGLIFHSSVGQAMDFRSGRWLIFKSSFLHREGPIPGIAAVSFDSD
jgi:hypothetical protein